MTSRLHARSKRAAASSPRIFTAAKGLTVSGASSSRTPSSSRTASKASTTSRPTSPTRRSDRKSTGRTTASRARPTAKHPPRTPKGGGRPKQAKAGTAPKRGGTARSHSRWALLHRTTTTKAKGKPSSPKRRRPASAATRRSRIPVALAAVVAVVILATSFPLGTLLGQHRQLSASAAQLQALQHENRSLSEQQQQLNSKAAIERLARQDYQLVQPGQTLYDVLPPSGTTATTAAGSPVVGDPGDQPLVAPANAPDMSPDPDLANRSSTAGATPTAPAAAGGSAAASTPTVGFWSRVTNSLEFWK